MNIKREVCWSCRGTGKSYVYKPIAVDEATGINTAERVEVACGNCEGKGYTEQAVFSVEEAKAILKFCGLTTES